MGKKMAKKATKKVAIRGAEKAAAKASGKTASKVGKPGVKTVARKAAARAAPEMKTRRKDYGEGADGVFAAMTPGVRELGLKLREIVQKARPKATELTRWGHAMYDENGIVCAITASKSHVNLQFFDASMMDDPDGRLEGTGATARHVKVRSEKDIDAKRFAQWVKTAGSMRKAGK